MIWLQCFGFAHANYKDSLWSLNIGLDQGFWSPTFRPSTPTTRVNFTHKTLVSLHSFLIGMACIIKQCELCGQCLDLQTYMKFSFLKNYRLAPNQTFCTLCREYVAAADGMKSSSISICRASMQIKSLTAGWTQQPTDHVTRCCSHRIRLPPKTMWRLMPRSHRRRRRNTWQFRRVDGTEFATTQDCCHRRKIWKVNTFRIFWRQTLRDSLVASRRRRRSELDNMPELQFFILKIIMDFIRCRHRHQSQRAGVLRHLSGTLSINQSVNQSENF